MRHEGDGRHEAIDAHHERDGCERLAETLVVCEQAADGREAQLALLHPRERSALVAQERHSKGAMGNISLLSLIIGGGLCK